MAMSMPFEVPRGVLQWAEPASTLAVEEEVAVNIYQNFAEVYDGFGSEQFCLALFSHIKEILDRYQIHPPSPIVDLACGTGVITVELAKQGFQVTGLDLSEDMMRRAMIRADLARVPVDFRRADLRGFQLDRPASCMISTHDSLDHLFDDDEFDLAFEHISQNLASGGLFVFDMNCWDGIRHLHGKTTFVESAERSAVYRMTAVDASLETNITGFVKDPDGRYQRFNETLYQRCYMDEEIQDRIDDFDFHLLERFVVQELEGDRFKQIWVARRN